MSEAKWAQVKDFPDYWISDDGRVLNLRKKRILKHHVKNGTKFVTFSLGKGKYIRSVNKLQVLYFGGVGVSQNDQKEKEEQS